MFWKKSAKPTHLSPDWLLVGLGNPGPRYAHTRHNVGWWVLDELARRYKPSRTASELNSQVDWLSLSGPEDRLVVASIKPLTFMNRSGQSVVRWLQKYEHAKLCVVYDDVDTPVGRLRIRAEGSAGGHNGMKSLIAALKTQEFTRLRVGVGRPPEGVDRADYVLEPPDRGEREQIERSVLQAADVVEVLLEYGFDAAQRKVGELNNPQKPE